VSWAGVVLCCSGLGFSAVAGEFALASARIASLDRSELTTGGRRALRVGRTRSNSSQPPLLGRYMPARPSGLRIARNLTSGAGMNRS
jgi:hypothetical protein